MRSHISGDHLLDASAVCTGHTWHLWGTLPAKELRRFPDLSTETHVIVIGPIVIHLQRYVLAPPNWTRVFNSSVLVFYDYRAQPDLWREKISALTLGAQEIREPARHRLGGCCMTKIGRGVQIHLYPVCEGEQDYDNQETVVMRVATLVINVRRSLLTDSMLERLRALSSQPRDHFQAQAVLSVDSSIDASERASMFAAV